MSRPANHSVVDEVHGFIKTLDEVLSGVSAKKLALQNESNGLNGQNGH